MAAHKLEDRQAALVPWIAGLVLAAPLAFTYYPPMNDFAAHEALVAILRNFGDRTKYPPGLYVHNFGQTQQLFHVLSLLLSYVMPVHAACKLVVGASLVAILVGAARLARHMGKTPWVALLVAPLAMGWTFYWGFVANLCGLACFLFAIPAIDDLAARPTARRALVVAGWFVLQYAAHEAPLFVLCGFVVMLMVLRAPSLRGALWGALPIAVGAALVVGQALAQEHLRTRANLHVGARWFPISAQLKALPQLLFVRSADTPIVVLSAVLDAGVLAAFFRARSREPWPQEGWRARLERMRFMLLGAACIFLYVVMPIHLNGATWVFHRFFPLGAAILLVACAPRQDEPLWVVTKALLAAIPVVVVLSSLPEFATASRINRELDDVLAQIEPGSAVANIDVHGIDPSQVFRPIMTSSRVLSARGGRLLLSFADSSISPVIIDMPYRWDEALVRNNVYPLLFRPSFDLLRYRYVLLFTTDPTIAGAARDLLEPDAELLSQRGPWALYRSRIWRIPPVSPDSRSPKQRPPTLVDNFHAAGLPTATQAIDFDVDELYDPSAPSPPHPRCPSSWETPPPLDPALVPPGGPMTRYWSALSRVEAHASAKGTQDYVCAPSSAPGAPFAWTLVGPEATLTYCDGTLLGRHFASPDRAGAPEWQALDGSWVVGKKVASVAAPKPGAVPWLLVQVMSRGGARTFALVGWVLRLGTSGGIAPANGCDAEHAGATVKVPYTAEYWFISG